MHAFVAIDALFAANQHVGAMALLSLEITQSGAVTALLVGGLNLVALVTNTVAVVTNHDCDIKKTIVIETAQASGGMKQTGFVSNRVAVAGTIAPVVIFQACFASKQSRVVLKQSQVVVKQSRVVVKQS
jgi:hypothetical protein